VSDASGQPDPKMSLFCQPTASRPRDLHHLIQVSGTWLARLSILLLVRGIHALLPMRTA